MMEPASKARLLAAVLALSAVIESLPIYSPTSSWSSSQQVGASDPGAQYSRGGLPRPRHYPAPRPEDRYGVVAPRHQYTYSGYPHRGLEAKASQLDYEIDQPYQNEVNIYEYSYTESSAYGEGSHKYGGGVGRRVVGLPRRLGERLWWPLPVLGAPGDAYLPRGITPEGQHRHLEPQAEHSHGTGHRAPGDASLVVQNDSLIGMVRVQKSLHPTWETAVHAHDYPGAWAPPTTTTPTTTITTTTAAPGTARGRGGFDSFLQMMSQDQTPAAAVVVVVPEESGSGASSAAEGHRVSSSSSSIGSGQERQQKVLPRVGGTSEQHEDSSPFTTTAILSSILLLILLVVVMVALRVQWRERLKAQEEEWPVKSPTVQPATPAASSSMGPSPTQHHHLDPLMHLHPEPIRIKAKGLLERRGSNTSLTLELAPNCPPPEVTSPPRHCTPEEFLMTAGNRMSRRQLRQCLKEARALHAEFWEVPLNQPDKCDVPGSASKNRYRTVLPNEATRVHLHTGDPATQYINANYVRGYDGEERAYIVTQGPLAHTVGDLWRLVMQERCPAVVMITRLKEKQRVKCEPYVPAHSATYGAVTVTVRQVIQKSGYTIRKILLQCGQEMHETLHFWYTAWPDHKAPTDPEQLLALALQVDHIRKAGDGEEQGPVVVHCSAGIGRSGCFVAISIAINQLLEEDCVDILGIVCQMRLDRGGMVQTGEQYEFIHRAVALYASTLPSFCSGK